MVPHVSPVNTLSLTEWHQWVTFSRGVTSSLALLQEGAHHAQCNALCPGQLSKTPEGHGRLLSVS